MLLDETSVAGQINANSEYGAEFSPRSFNRLSDDSEGQSPAAPNVKSLAFKCRDPYQECGGAVFAKV